MQRDYELDFRRYPRDQLPEAPGIYCVYAASPKKGRIFRLLYIGEAANIWNRVEPNTHLAWRRWQDESRRGQELFITAAEFDGTSDDRERAEKALIYEHQPPYNTVGKKSFNYGKTTIVTTGDNYKLRDYFVVAGRDAAHERSSEATLENLWKWFRSR